MYVISKSGQKIPTKLFKNGITSVLRNGDKIHVHIIFACYYLIKKLDKENKLYTYETYFISTSNQVYQDMHKQTDDKLQKRVFQNACLHYNM